MIHMFYVLIAFEHAMLTVKWLINWIVKDIPGNVQKELEAKTQLNEKMTSMIFSKIGTQTLGIKQQLKLQYNKCGLGLNNILKRGIKSENKKECNNWAEGEVKEEISKPKKADEKKEDSANIAEEHGADFGTAEISKK